MVGPLGAVPHDRGVGPPRRAGRHHPGEHRWRHALRAARRHRGLGADRPGSRRGARLPSPRVPPGRNGACAPGPARAVCGEVEFFYEDLGDPAGAPVLLIMGVGAQLPMWPDGFCELADRARLSGDPATTTATSACRPRWPGRRPTVGLRAHRPIRGRPHQPGALHAGRHGRGREGRCWTISRSTAHTWSAHRWAG